MDEALEKQFAEYSSSRDQPLNYKSFQSLVSIKYFPHLFVKLGDIQQLGEVQFRFFDKEYNLKIENWDYSTSYFIGVRPLKKFSKKLDLYPAFNELFTSIVLEANDKRDITGNYWKLKDFFNVKVYQVRDTDI